MTEPVDVAMVADDAYTRPLHAALVSLAAAARTPLRLHLLSAQSNAAASSTQTLLRALRIEARFIDRRDVAAHLATRTDLSESFRTHAHYAKLLLPELLGDLDRVLYLDDDVIARHDLGELWSAPLNGAILAAVPDASFAGAAHDAFRAAHGGRYFNSGVMLVDLAAWRAADIGGVFADWRRFYERAGGAFPWVAYWEQSPLNMAVAGRWAGLSPRWNFWPSFVARTGAEPHGLSPESFAAFVGVTVEELHRAEDDPAVVHFAGPNKPWLPEHLSNPSPWFAAWREHAARAQRLIDDEAARRACVVPAQAERVDGLHGLAAILHARLAVLRSPVRLLQVGAHNGRDSDPYHALLRSHAWHGVLIEPVAHLFAALCQTYAGCPGAVTRQVAAGAVDGRAAFFAVKPVDPPPTPWFSQISSFEIAPFAGHLGHIPLIAELIEEVTVQTRTLDTLVAEHDFAPDVVSISAEGHDAKVLSGLDLREHRPSVIRLHIQHLTELDRTGAAVRLKRAGYVAARDATHLLAFQPVLLDAGELRAIVAGAAGVTFL